MPKVEFSDWCENDKLLLLEGWARDGLTEEQIAHNIGISRTTLYEWKKKEPNIMNALKKGKEVVDIEVENALLKSALNGNITAQIFWLKNRKSNKWRDKSVIEDETNKTGILTELVEALNNGKKD